MKNNRWRHTVISAVLLAGVWYFAAALQVQAATICTAAASGDWQTASVWQNCNGGVPGAGDAAIIASGVTVQLNANVSVASLTIDTNTTVGSDGVNIASGVTLDVSGAVTEAAALTGGSELNVGDGTLRAQAISLTGGTGGNVTALTVHDGTVAVAGSISFAGNAAGAKYESTGASNTMVGGDFASGGTLVTNGTGTITFDGHGRQLMGSYATYNVVKIANDHDIVGAAGSVSVGGLLQVDNGSFGIDVGNIHVAGPTILNSRMVVNAMGGTLAFGDLTINDSGALVYGKPEPTTINGDLTVNGRGAILGTTGLWTFQKPGGVVHGTAVGVGLTKATFAANYTLDMRCAVNDLSVNKNRTLTNNNVLTVDTALHGAGSEQQVSGSTLYVGGSASIAGLNALASGNTVIYNGSHPQTLRSVPYDNLFVTSGANVSMTAPAQVHNNLTVGGQLHDGGFQLSGNPTGHFDLLANGLLTLGSAAAATIFPTGFAGNHTALNQTSTVVYNANGAQTISSLPVYGNLETAATAAATKTPDGALQVHGNFKNGAQNAFANGVSQVEVWGDAAQNGSWTGGGKLLLTNGSRAHAVSGSFVNVTLNDAAGAQLGDDVRLGGALLIASGQWDEHDHSETVAGATEVWGGLEISGSQASTFGDLDLHDGGGMHFASAKDIALNGDLASQGSGQITGATGTWTFHKSGGTIHGGSPGFGISGDANFVSNYGVTGPFGVQAIAVQHGATLGNASQLTVNGDISGAGSFVQHTGGTAFLRGNASVATFDAAAVGNSVVYDNPSQNQTVRQATYCNLLIQKSASTATIGNGTTTVRGDLFVVQGTLSLGQSHLSVIGSSDVFGTLLATSSSASTFGDTATVRSGGAWKASGSTADFAFHNGLHADGVSFAAGNGTYTFAQNNQRVDGSLPLLIHNVVVNNITLQNSGSLVIDNSLSGTGTLAQGVNSTLSLAGALTVHALDAAAAGNTVTYTGAAAPTILRSTYQTLDLSPLVSNAATTGGNVTVDTKLNLGATVLAPANNSVTLGQNASVGRSSGYVVGSLSKTFAASGAFTFEVGDAAHYTPIDFNVSGVGSAGTVTASIGSAKLGATLAGLALIQPTSGINRTWTLADSGLTFGNYGATLHFVSGDVDAGANVSNMVVARRSSGAWSIVHGFCGGTSCDVVSQIAMGDFQAGTQPAIVTTLSSSQTPPITTTPRRTAVRAPAPTGATGATAPAAGGTGAAPTTPARAALFDISAQGPANKRNLWPLIVLIILGIIMGMLLTFSVTRRRARERKQVVL